MVKGQRQRINALLQEWDCLNKIVPISRLDEVDVAVESLKQLNTFKRILFVINNCKQQPKLDPNSSEEQDHSTPSPEQPTNYFINDVPASANKFELFLMKLITNRIKSLLAAGPPRNDQRTLSSGSSSPSSTSSNVSPDYQRPISQPNSSYLSEALTNNLSGSHSVAALYDHHQQQHLYDPDYDNDEVTLTLLMEIIAEDTA